MERCRGSNDGGLLSLSRLPPGAARSPRRAARGLRGLSGRSCRSRAFPPSAVRVTPIRVDLDEFETPVTRGEFHAA
jgi:hypothetical protein